MMTWSCEHVREEARKSPSLAEDEREGEESQEDGDKEDKRREEERSMNQRTRRKIARNTFPELTFPTCREHRDGSDRRRSVAHTRPSSPQSRQIQSRFVLVCAGDRCCRDRACLHAKSESRTGEKEGKSNHLFKGLYANTVYSHSG